MRHLNSQEMATHDMIHLFLRYLCRNVWTYFHWCGPQWSMAACLCNHAISCVRTHIHIESFLYIYIYFWYISIYIYTYVTVHIQSLKDPQARGFSDIDFECTGQVRIGAGAFVGPQCTLEPGCEVRCGASGVTGHRSTALATIPWTWTQHGSGSVSVVTGWFVCSEVSFYPVIIGNRYLWCESTSARGYRENLWAEPKKIWSKPPLIWLVVWFTFCLVGWPAGWFNHRPDSLTHWLTVRIYPFIPH